MPDAESRSLDQEILAFMRRYRDLRAPEISFELLAFRLFEYQYRRNSPYRKFCRIQKRSPGDLRTWKEIPALPTEAFKEFSVASFPVKRRRRVFRTSGTTRAKKGTHPLDTLHLYESSILPPFKKYFLPDGARGVFFFLVAAPAAQPQSSLSYMMGVVNKRLAKGRGRFYVRQGRPRFEKLLLDLRQERKKVFLFSTAFALKGFLDLLASKKTKLRLPRGSRLLETGGFKGRTREISKKRLYRQCEKYLGVPRTHCVSEYGMTELSSQTYDTTLWDHVRGKKRAPVKAGPAWMRTLVIDPRTGQEAPRGRLGLLRHVDLANRPSVVSVQTEDLGRAAGEGFELLGRAKNSELRGCSLSHEEWMRAFR